MLTLYADFACPYCYVEYELLLRLGRGEAFRFCPVSLLPKSAVPWDTNDPLITKILDEGWDAFMAKNPDLDVIRPPSLPNTLLASQAVAEALEVDAGQAKALVTALFRALWRDARDLGKSEVVLELWHEVGLPPRESFGRDSRVAARLWQTEWTNMPFAQRVPVIANEEGQRLLGLASEEDLLAFLDDPRAGRHSPEVCEP